MEEKGISRRGFIRGSAQVLGSALIASNLIGDTAPTRDKEKSLVFRVRNSPRPLGENYHKGFEALLDLMGKNGLKFYKTTKPGNNSGPEGIIAKDDLVLIKVNGQWRYRGTTNSDVIRGLIQRILDHPDGFEGEIVIFDNGQGEGSLAGDAHGWGHYPDTKVHANAEDELHSFTYLADEVFDGKNVSCYLLDDIREIFISADDHKTDGYRRLNDVSYPCFTTAAGKRCELKEGIWTRQPVYAQNLKLINVPVLKHHQGCGVTACLKNFYGVLSMDDGFRRPRHYDLLGKHTGKMISSVRAPVLNILDCIWVSLVNHYGFPAENTHRLNELLASTDPVALDYWASKYILSTLEREEHHPDEFEPLRNYLADAATVINTYGGIGGKKVKMRDENIRLIEYAF